MKITFTGSHGTGKSTLVKLLSRHSEFEKFKIFDGVGRRIHTEKKWSDKRKQHYFNWYYVRKHFFTKNFIASRGLIDTLAYSRVTVDFWYHSRLFNWGFKHIYYDHVFYIPIEFPLESDGVRYGEELQPIIDKDIKLILDFYHIPYHVIEGTVEERYKLVCQIVGLEPIVYTYDEGVFDINSVKNVLSEEDEELCRVQEAEIRSIQVKMSEEDGEAFTTVTGKVEE